VQGYRCTSTVSSSRRISPRGGAGRQGVARSEPTGLVACSTASGPRAVIPVSGPHPGLAEELGEAGSVHSIRVASARETLAASATAITGIAALAVRMSRDSAARPSPRAAPHTSARSTHPRWGAAGDGGRISPETVPLTCRGAPDWGQGRWENSHSVVCEGRHGTYAHGCTRDPAAVAAVGVLTRRSRAVPTVLLKSSEHGAHSCGHGAIDARTALHRCGWTRPTCGGPTRRDARRSRSERNRTSAI
jgi:hypothetical protein